MFLGEESPNFVCPEDDIAATGCKGPKDCLYPNPDSCESFIHCEVNADGVTGRPTIQDCPSGLQWNDNTKECDYPEQSTCNSTSTEQPSTPPAEETTTEGNTETTTEEASTEQPSSSTGSSSVETTTGSGTDETTTGSSAEETTTESGETTTGSGDGETTTEAAGEETTTEADTTTTEQASTTEADTTTTDQPSTTEADTTTTEQPSTTEQSTTAQTTEQTSTAQPTSTNQPTTEQTTARPSTTEATSTTESSGGSTDFVCPTEDIINTKCMGPKDCLYPNPDSCTSFIHCEVNADGVTGRPTIQDCPGGLQWNDNKKECDWPSSSTCPNRRWMVQLV